MRQNNPKLSLFCLCFVENLQRCRDNFPRTAKKSVFFEGNFLQGCFSVLLSRNINKKYLQSMQIYSAVFLEKVLKIQKRDSNFT
jgi:hypothetical protein